MKTIRQLNQEAAEWVSYNWLKFSEQILEGGKNPASLTTCLEDKTYCRLNLIPELFYEQAEKQNKRWWVSDKNWEKIKAAAKTRAELSLRFLGAEKYPLTLAHFTKPSDKQKELDGKSDACAQNTESGGRKNAK